ncbi:hypothetical protein BBJ28_00018965 [Nothophytophthora sp. Chile5]|nr:hypothetical protein BBJ28_00018965 [Nothophytophthora sp. Chile5]
MLKKKEKLEQMRELGRGGLSKGLSFLRTAATNAALEGGDASAPAAASSSSEGATRMSYEELLALSMKLTRQNKLMKAQFQKTQARLASAAASDADCRLLRGFVRDEVGVDLAACARPTTAEEDEEKAAVGAIDGDALRERYRILVALREKEKAQKTEKQATGYDEIDLMGGGGQREQQLEAAAQQVERMREQLREGSELTQKLAERETQLRLALEDARQTLERREAELRSEQQETQQMWQTRWDEQSAVLAALRSQEPPQAEEREPETSEQTPEGTEELQTALKAANDENLRLHEQVETLEAASSAASRAAETQIGDAGSAEASAALAQELERMKLAEAERAHETRALQEKLHAADEQLAKARGERECSESLVEALKADTSRLADQVARFEQQQLAVEQERETRAALEKQLAEERVYWTSKLEGLITDGDTASTKTEALEAKLREKEKQVTGMAASQTAMTSELMELQQQLAGMREDLAMAADGLEAHATKAEASDRRCVQSEKEAAELKTQLETLREQQHEDLEMLRREKETELERVQAERRSLVTERDVLLRGKQTLEIRGRALERELEATRKHEQELETALSEQTFQVGNLSVDLAETKKALSDRMALATRLQTENMGMAGKQAEQVALIESALRDAATSKTAQQEMETQVQAAKADVKRAKQSESRAQRALEELQLEMRRQEERLQEERGEAKLALETAVTSEKLGFQREVERLEAESKHKSKLALQVVLEKEKEIAQLSARLGEVEEDVRSGDADNRKILEFAQLQAKREAEARMQAMQMQELSQKLEDAYGELQELREGKRRHAEELTAMLQTQRRDGVNMEYLKNVVVQYMSFRPGSSQQARLVPVLTTLLQFTAADLREVKRATTNRRGNSWTSWSSSDAGSIDYKPIVVGAGHRHPMAPPGSTSAAQDDGADRRSLPARTGSAPTSEGSPPSPQSSRASSFYLPNGSNVEATDPSAESADF